MRLAELVALVGRLRATSKKTEKVAQIAALLQQAREREIELLALYLTGTLAQGRIGTASQPASHGSRSRSAPARACR